MNKCKRCFLYEIAGKEDVYAHVLRTRELLAAKDKASDAVYDKRLASCRECDSLLEATCLKCGCYVEIRALKKDATCPLKRW
ncbi:DUF6171 family protein [Butyrivibrio sp. TB]|uniref:DUF6171 family protein n=1 Tax=Butyrivibrio sp. TB TaxID=1520809 RepID=UPI0008CE0142|nr:DUF6171 family protein [Butyrivibrio sp. TB]SEP80552.1 hypothetical protein SAMN02910382_01055 [Butyrivibrio sp. TB]